jgi:DNA-binding CsgD family transcriptional regulator
MPKQRSFSPDALTERERIVVEMLAAGNTMRATAIKAGLSEKSIWNYRKRKHVQEAIYARQAEMFDGTGGQGLSLLPEVVQTLRDIVNDTEARASDRIQASRALIASANEYQARRQLERQIRDLEARLFGSQVSPEPGDANMAPEPDDEDENASDLLINILAAEDQA